MNLPTAARLTAVCLALSLAGCQLIQRQHEEPPPPPPAPPTIHEPLATHMFQIASPDDSVVGELQITKVMGEDTLPDIARRFNLGFEEIQRANPGVDAWVPGEGREIVLPTQFVLPAAPREGLVINLAQLRVFYFPKVKEGEPQTVITHPIGIGKVGWQTPEGTTKVTGKRTNPTWFPPASVRKEHKEAGDPLPSKVPPGPDNPLGTYMMTLGWPSYLIHGTNKPYGVGLRSSHGCMRFYPEDIAELYGKIPVGTKVTVVNQPFVFGWHDGALYVQAFPVMEDDEREHPKAADKLLNAAISDDMWKKVKEHGAAIDLEAVNGLMAQPRGIALPVSKPKGVTLDAYVTAARHVENRVPPGANWNGSEEMYYTAEEFEAARDGTPLPKKPAPKAAKKTATKPAPAPTGTAGATAGSR
ncbi:MAG TPA: L,D-transpeptidase family protein [Steroidobacteraceae bacterium]|nr:L,D-transpeptidase family protein [Steroidobacteraceae bacterium]